MDSKVEKQPKAKTYWPITAKSFGVIIHRVIFAIFVINSMFDILPFDISHNCLALILAYLVFWDVLSVRVINYLNFHTNTYRNEIIRMIKEKAAINSGGGVAGVVKDNQNDNAVLDDGEKIINSEQLSKLNEINKKATDKFREKQKAEQAEREEETE